MGFWLLMYAAAAYIFTMLALYMLGIAKLVQKEGQPPLFYVFLPFAHEYARAVIVGTRGQKLRVLSPLASAGLLGVLAFPNAFYLFGSLIFFAVTQCFLNYYTYEKKTALLFTLLGLFIPFSSGIWIFYTYRKSSYIYQV